MEVEIICVNSERPPAQVMFVGDSEIDVMTARTLAPGFAE